MRRSRWSLPSVSPLNLLGAALLLAGCATVTPKAAPSPADAPVSPDVVTVFVGPFGSAFAREMRVALGAELQRSPRIRVVGTEVEADYMVSGSLGVNVPIYPTARLLAPAGSMQLLDRATGTTVFTYVYRDQQSGGEVVAQDAQQQVRTVARQFGMQLRALPMFRAPAADAVMPR